MRNEKNPIISDEFLNELVKDINEEFGWDTVEQNVEHYDHETHKN
ncbi:hypothetical protein [Neobacillus sp. SAB-20_R2A]